MESKIINNKFLPGNSKRANPYAVRALENVMPTTARNVTIKELIRYLVKGCAVHASAKLAKCSSFGKKLGGYAKISAGDFRAVTSAQKNGNKNIRDKQIRIKYKIPFDIFFFI